MGSQNTTNTRAFIESEIYSSMILRVYDEYMLPEQFYHNIAEFDRGDSYRIPSIGAVQLQTMSEETPPIYQSITTGETFLYMTDHKGDAWSVTDELREDGTNIDALVAARTEESVKAFARDRETRAFEVLNNAQTPGNTNAINSVAHRFLATGGTGPNFVMEIADLVNVRLAFDTAAVPSGGRVGIIHPQVEASLTLKYTGTYAVDQNNTFLGVLQQGFAQDHRISMMIMGITLMISNLLPHIATETIGGTPINNAVANIFMCVASDMDKPLMFHERRAPAVFGEYNKDLGRDEFVSRTRYAMGVKRLESLVIVLASATAIA